MKIHIRNFDARIETEKPFLDCCYCSENFELGHELQTDISRLDGKIFCSVDCLRAEVRDYLEDNPPLPS